MKKALIFSTAYFPLVGGAEVAMKEITDRIHDIEFHLITAKIRADLASQERMGNVMVYRVGFGHAIDKYLLPCFGPLKALTLIKANETHFHWALMASFGGFASLLYKLLRPRVPFLLTLQEGDPLEYIEKRVAMVKPLFRMIFQKANEVQAISHFLAKWAKANGFLGKPVVIPNGVDIHAFDKPVDLIKRNELRTQWGLSESDFVIVTASRLVTKNATDDTIRALALLSENVKFVLAGEGQDQEMLQALAKSLNVDSRIVWLGTRSHAELPDILQACDVFCRPSRSEGLGNSFLEAMAAGVPIIGTLEGGIPDFLTDGETGLACKANDPASIALAVRVYQENLEQKSRIIEQGKALVRKQYQWNVISQRIRELIGKMI